MRLIESRRAVRVSADGDLVPLANQGPQPLESRVDALDLDRFHAIRADLLRRLGRIGDAGRAYDAALARGQNASEREFLQRRRAQLEPS